MSPTRKSAQKSFAILDHEQSNDLRNVRYGAATTATYRHAAASRTHQWNPTKATTRRDVRFECADGHDASALNSKDVCTTMPIFSPTCTTSKRGGVRYECVPQLPPRSRLRLGMNVCLIFPLGSSIFQPDHAMSCATGYVRNASLVP
ncbi:hypothetical protein Tcan_00132, partial [Toxocara canis]